MRPGETGFKNRGKGSNGNPKTHLGTGYDRRGGQCHPALGALHKGKKSEEGLVEGPALVSLVDDGDEVLVPIQGSIGFLGEQRLLFWRACGVVLVRHEDDVKVGLRCLAKEG